MKKQIPHFLKYMRLRKQGKLSPPALDADSAEVADTAPRGDRVGLPTFTELVQEWRYPAPPCASDDAIYSHSGTAQGQRGKLRGLPLWSQLIGDYRGSEGL